MTGSAGFREPHLQLVFDTSHFSAFAGALETLCERFPEVRARVRDLIGRGDAFTCSCSPSTGVDGEVVRIGATSNLLVLCQQAGASAVDLLPLRPSLDLAKLQLGRLNAAVRDGRLTPLDLSDFVDFPDVLYPPGASSGLRYHLRQDHYERYKALAAKVRHEADLSGDLSPLFGLLRSAAPPDGTLRGSRSADGLGDAP